MEANMVTKDCEYLGVLRHQLSHRELIVSVWKDVGSEGTNPLSVALSSLDRRILELAGIVVNIP